MNEKEKLRVFLCPIGEELAKGEWVEFPCDIQKIHERMGEHEKYHFQSPNNYVIIRDKNGDITNELTLDELNILGNKYDDIEEFFNGEFLRKCKGVIGSEIFVIWEHFNSSIDYLHKNLDKIDVIDHMLCIDEEHIMPCTYLRFGRG